MKDTTHIETMLRSLFLTSFARNYDDFAKKAEREKLGHIPYLHELAQTECEERRNRRTDRLINQAKLPHGKSLDNFNFSKQPTLSVARVRELAQGEFLEHCENILLFGIPGSGKTHIAAGLAREWCLRGHHVLFTTAAMLVQELLAAKRDLRLDQLIKKLDRFQLVIDDISYIPHTREESDVLFVLLAERYEARSVVITSNLLLSQWDAVFKDPMTTRAAIDRLVHHATILELKDSYRQDEAKRRKKAQEEKKDPEEEKDQ
jgi:DNA replication protein DnaC